MVMRKIASGNVIIGFLDLFCGLIIETKQCYIDIYTESTGVQFAESKQTNTQIFALHLKFTDSP